MTLSASISLDEFDKRLNAANERRRQERLEREVKQVETLQLIAQYETTLDEIEAHLDVEPVTLDVFAGVRSKLSQLADRSREIAAAL